MLRLLVAIRDTRRAGRVIIRKVSDEKKEVRQDLSFVVARHGI